MAGSIRKQLHVQLQATSGPGAPTVPGQPVRTGQPEEIGGIESGQQLGGGEQLLRRSGRTDTHDRLAYALLTRAGISDTHHQTVSTDPLRSPHELLARLEVEQHARPLSLPNGMGLTNREADPIGTAPNELTASEDRDEFAGTPWHKSVPARLAAL